MARKRDDTIKLVLRLPPLLHRRLGRAATRKNQSLNSEMIERLQESFRGETAQDYRNLRKLSDVMAQRGRTTNPLTGRPLAEINEKLDRLIALAEAEESEDNGEQQ
jgi:hypothetical protein